MRLVTPLALAIIMALAAPVTADGPEEQSCEYTDICPATGLVIQEFVELHPSVCSGLHVWTDSGLYGIVEVISCGQGLFTGWKTAV